MMKQTNLKTPQKIYLPVKRLIGILGSFVDIILCFVSLLWRVISFNAIVCRGCPFFIYRRLSNNIKVFKMIEFRSIRLDANPYKSPFNMPKNKRLSMETGFERFLRKVSIKETPQLLNIFDGQTAYIVPGPVAAHDEEELVKIREECVPNAVNVKIFVHTILNLFRVVEGR